MADILVQLRIPGEVYERATAALEKIKKAHEDEVEVVKQQIEDCTDERRIHKLQSTWDALHERGRRVTIHNVIRVAIEDGLDSKDYQGILDRMAKDGVPLGRPRRVAG